MLSRCVRTRIAIESFGASRTASAGVIAGIVRISTGVAIFTRRLMQEVLVLTLATICAIVRVVVEALRVPTVRVAFASGAIFAVPLGLLIGVIAIGAAFAGG